MPNNVTQPISRVTLPALNDINDTLPGSGQPSISGNVYSYAAQLGNRMWLDGSNLGVKYDPAIGALYGGCFQYVQFYNSAAAPARGLPTSWAYDQATQAGNVYNAFQNYIVTVDMSALRTGRFAGVCLSAVAKGNYGWIQTKGLASCLFASSGLAATPADGDIVFVNAAGNNFLEQNDGGTVSLGLVKAAVGVAIGAPVAGALGTVLLKGVADVV